MMSERDVRHVEVLTEVLSGRRTVASAAIVLAVSRRQVQRLLSRYREDGGGALIHKGRGQASNHRLNPGTREYALELIRTRYADFGPTLAIEVLLDKHAIKVGRETLRTWMVEDGLWLSRKQRRSFHQPGMTQFGRALAELNIEIICANSSQAKGRVESVNRTLQDRLVKELRLDDVCDMQAGNDFLPEFLNRFNEKFSVRAAKPEDLHRRLALSPDRLSDILCHREQRHVGQQLTLAYDRKQLILERSALQQHDWGAEGCP
jgi:transposase